jgi:hypothetical protein
VYQLLPKQSRGAGDCDQQAAFVKILQALQFHVFPLPENRYFIDSQLIGSMA